MKVYSKKLGMMVFTILFVSFLVFLAFSVLPGDPATSLLGLNATKESVASLRLEMGLEDPLLVRYGRWIVGIFSGDLGNSYSYGIPVQELLRDKIYITLQITALSFFLLILVSIPLGIYTAKRNGSKTDRIIMVLNQITMSIPPFFMGILFTYLFGMVFHLFVPGGYISYKTNYIGFLTYIIFPALAIALPKIAMTTKVLRGAILEQIDQDYVRTAYSRGNDSNHVYYRHILKNAMIPLITFIGMIVTDMIAGSIIMEQVFQIPGLGRILLTSIINRDYPVVQAIIMYIALFVVVINFIVDILYRMIDPRIREE